MEEGIPSSCARRTLKDGAFGVSSLSTSILRHSSFLEVSVNRMGDQVKPRRTVSRTEDANSIQGFR